MPRITRSRCAIHQGDSYFSQANPVSTTLYPWKDESTGNLLGTQKNVRIISVAAYVTWAVTQPTPLEIVCTVDGKTIIFVKGSPISAMPYTGYLSGELAENNQQMAEGAGLLINRSFLLEGRSVKVEARITWAVTQPTPFVLRVKWAKIP